MRIILAAALVMACGTARAQHVTPDERKAYFDRILDYTPPNREDDRPFVRTPDNPQGGGGGGGGACRLPDGATLAELPACTRDSPFWVGAAPTKRAYTLDEVDRMRRAIAFTADGADLMHPLPAAMVEDQLRTYMAAGISPEELERKVEGK